MQSLYRRPLPEALIEFGSADGRALFREALALGTMESYFALAEQHHTQADPAFCGLGSLVVVLNALAIDPGRLWKGPWRWFSEEMLDCCVSLEVVRRAGLTLGEVGCLARCNGADARVVAASAGDEEVFRQAILQSSRSATGPFLIAAYSRAALGQSGQGHYSPIGGYHAGRDLVLLLDVARFKYPPHWVPLPQLFRAMQAADPVTGQSRGFIQLVRAESPVSLALVFSRQGEGWRGIADFVTHAVPRLLREAAQGSPEQALRLVLQGASEVAAGLALRPSVEPPHREAVERVLAQLRSSPVFALAERACPGASAELAATLLYMVPSEAWEGLAPEVSRELQVLLDLDRLEVELRNDVRALRKQLAELVACRT